MRTKRASPVRRALPRRQPVGSNFQIVKEQCDAPLVANGHFAPFNFFIFVVAQKSFEFRFTSRVQVVVRPQVREWQWGDIQISFASGGGAKPFAGEAKLVSCQVLVVGR